jgi:NAD(P)-dependent dehydrogenase (short-subunit alcohol dehydrogenase family)
MADGVVLLNVAQDDERVPILRSAPQPGALVGMRGDCSGVDVFDLDFETAGRLMVEHVHAHGHRELILVSQPEQVVDQSGRVAVVTGANSGLGLATALALAGKGTHVVMAARDAAKAALARDRIRAESPGASVEIVALDLGSLASVEQAAGQILAAHPAIDLLITNAGVMATPQGRTADGFETQLAVNHLGHWAMTSHLLPALVRTRDARVVTVTSGAQHTGRPLDPADPFRLGDYDPWRAYADSKLANRHFAQGLDRQFREAGLSARALTAHPGMTNSDLQATTVAAGGGSSAPVL